MKRVVAGKNLLLENNPPQLAYLDTFQAVGGKVWPASELMVNYLTSSDIAHNKSVLELGSGCGYVGIACAVLGAKHVTLTDRTITQRNLVHDAEGMLIEEQMPPNRLLLDICGRNIAANSYSTGSATMNVRELHWGEDHSAHIDNAQHSVPYDLIIGSDVTYHAELSESLFWTVSQLMKRSVLRADAIVNGGSAKTLDVNKDDSAPNSVTDADTHITITASAMTVCSSNSKTPINTVLVAVPAVVPHGPAMQKLRFIVSHQHRLDSATALTLATAKKFGLHCSTLATSADSDGAGSNGDGRSSASNAATRGGSDGNRNMSREDADCKPPGEYVIWQFTM